jgi:hydrogenase maturation factor
MKFMNDKNLSGAMTCARYAFAPNYYHYCGPDTGGEFGEYLKHEVMDEGLINHLTSFEVMYPYLQAIAQANEIKDPLDPEVVEAYWVGNQLLEKVGRQDVYMALTDSQHLTKRISKNELRWLLPKIDQEARLHHSFHVLNVFTRTGHHTVEHTIDTMDQCRISWGKVIGGKRQNLKSSLKLKTQQLIYEEGKLKMVPTEKEVVVPTEEYARNLKKGDWVSVHWGFVCDKLSTMQVRRLQNYTKHHMRLANETI